MKCPQNIPELISKQVLGTITPQQEAILGQWIEESPENLTLYHSLTHPDFLLSQKEKYDRIDSDAAFRRIGDRIGIRRRRLGAGKSVAAAAVIAAVVILGALLIPTRERVATEAAHPPQGSRTAVLIQDKTVTLLAEDSQTPPLLEDGIHFIGNNVGISYLDPHTVNLSTETEIVYNTLLVPRGGKYSVVLRDGTEVHLNSQSQLRFPVSFADGERRVFLTGEAHFNVENDPLSPFVVELTSGSEVRVLGTRFNVRDYPDETVEEVTLEQGIVRYESYTGQFTLEPGDQLTAHENGEVKKRNVDPALFSSWKEGLFAFRDTPLEEVMRTISRWYDIEVCWHDESMKDILFSGRIYDYHDLGSVVRMLEMTGDNRFEIDDNIIHIQR